MKAHIRFIEVDGAIRLLVSPDEGKPLTFEISKNRALVAFADLPGIFWRAFAEGEKLKG